MNNKEVNFKRTGLKPLVCIAIVSFQLFVFSSFAQNPNPDGTVYGSSLTWSLDLSDSTLTIDGNDTMPDYDTEDPPWFNGYGNLPHPISKLVIKDSVKSIGNWAFSGGFCGGLVSVTIGNSVTTINKWAFSNCYYLKFLSIGKSVTVIKSGAFGGGVNLDTIICYANIPPTIDEEKRYEGSTFIYIPTTVSFYVPCGSIAAYQAAYGWKDFTNYQVIGFPQNSFPLPDSVTVLQQDKAMEVSWQNTNALRYEVYRNKTLLTTTTATTYTDTSNLTNGTNYCYKIKAIYASCESGFSKDTCKKYEYKDVGINNYELNNTNYVLYPNPTDGQLRIMNYELRDGDIEIYDIVGRKVVNCQLSIGNSINISHLANGLYFLKIGNKTVKVVKN